MEATDLYLRLGVALAIGLGVGLERGWKQRDELSGHREAGIRTFAILALAGFAVGTGIEKLGAVFAATIALGVLTVVAIGYVRDTWAEDGDRGATTEIAALLTFILGGLAGVGEVLAAGLTGVLLVALLDYKDALHGLLKRIDRLELTAAVKLLLVSVVLLPVLPDEGYGPGGVLNPYQLWWAVVIIGALGFAGHVAVRTAGARRGAFVMGLTGGLLSSTGVTINAARLSRGGPGIALPLAGSIAVAQAVMFVRTGVVTALLNAALLPYIVPALALGAIAAATGALILIWRVKNGTGPDEATPTSPDMLGSAMQFVAVVAVVLVVAYYAHEWLGDAGIVVSGLLSGAVDVDAAVVSAARLAGTQLHTTSAHAASASIVVALAANSFVKSGIALVLGARALAWPAIAVLAASGAAAVTGLAIAAAFGGPG